MRPRNSTSTSRARWRQNTLTLTGVTFDSVASFRQLNPLDDTLYVDLQRSTIDDGVLDPEADTLVLFDLQDGSLGDVYLAIGRAQTDLLTHFRFENASFKGFDFGAYRPHLNRVDWTIHDYVGLPPLEAGSNSTPTAGVLESTYLKAKNGANTIGDTKAAAEFFRKEMLYRRHQYASVVASSDRTWR